MFQRYKIGKNRKYLTWLHIRAGKRRLRAGWRSVVSYVRQPDRAKMELCRIFTPEKGNNSTTRRTMTTIIMLIATGFYSGFLPKAPGTWGTLVAIPIYLLLVQFSPMTYLTVLAILLVIAIITAGGAEKILDKKDPGAIVIDEIVGMLITLIGAPNHWLVILIGFGLFRFLDIIKPFPIRWVDRHLNGGLGIVLDDCLAGLFALIALQIIIPYIAL